MGYYVQRTSGRYGASRTGMAMVGVGGVSWVETALKSPTKASILGLSIGESRARLPHERDYEREVSLQPCK